MVLVVDFDGTLVRENSSRVLEDILMGKWTVLGPLLPGLGKLVGYRGDFRRRIVLSLSLRMYGPEKLKEAMTKTARQLTVREEFKHEKLIIVSSGLHPIIRNVVELHDLKVVGIYATKITYHNGTLKVKEVTINDKVRILKGLDVKTYVTDDPREATILRKAGIEAVLL